MQSQNTHNLRVFEAASILLFFIQGLRVVISVMFGIIYDQVFAGSPGPWLVVSNLLLVAALAAPAFVPRRPAPKWLPVCAALAAFARLAFSQNDASIRFAGSLVVVAAAGLYLAAVLRFERQALLPAFFTALAMDQFIRILGDSYDFGLRPQWWLIQFPWSMYILNLAVRLHRARTREASPASYGWSWGLAFGGLLFLETSLLSLPNAVAGWSGLPYWIPSLGLLVITLLFMDPALQARLVAFLQEGPAAARWLAAGLLPLSLLAGYFLRGPVAGAALLLAHALALFLALRLFAAQPQEDPGRRMHMGLALVGGSLFFLLLVFFDAFAFTYPYALPFMRGLGWAVFLVGALGAGLGFLAPLRVEPVPSGLALAPLLRVTAGVVVLAFAVSYVLPARAAPLEQDEPLQIATYNIHYGYDEEWHFTLQEIARTIAEEGVDIAMLQEVDVGRLTSYAVDDAYYLARQLRMNVYYLPTVEHLTGIAVLYRGEASEVEAALLPSLQEQTGIIRVSLETSGGPLHAFGVWMGLSNEDTQRQIQAALEFIGEHSPAAFGGDFNAQPGSPVAQAVEQAGFQDPFQVLGIEGAFTDPATNPEKQIDYVWLRGLEPQNAWVSDSTASDHRMVVVEVDLR